MSENVSNEVSPATLFVLMKAIDEYEPGITQFIQDPSKCKGNFPLLRTFFFFFFGGLIQTTPLPQVLGWNRTTIQQVLLYSLVISNIYIYLGEQTISIYKSLLYCPRRWGPDASCQDHSSGHVPHNGLLPSAQSELVEKLIGSSPTPTTHQLLIS